MRRNDKREQSQAKTNLTRSKSMGSLQHSAGGGIGSLKALFESKADTPRVARTSLRAAGHISPFNTAATMPVINGEVDEREAPSEEQSFLTPANVAAPPAKDANANANEEEVKLKVNACHCHWL